MWNQQNNAPPIPFRPGGPSQMPAPSGFGFIPGGFGGPPPTGMTNTSNFGLMTYGVSQNM